MFWLKHTKTNLNIFLLEGQVLREMAEELVKEDIDLVGCIHDIHIPVHLPFAGELYVNLRDLYPRGGVLNIRFRALQKGRTEGVGAAGLEGF